MGKDKSTYREDGFNTVAEKLWRAELITIHCESCKTRQKCYKPFLTLKTAKKVDTAINNIRICEERLLSLWF